MCGTPMMEQARPGMEPVEDSRGVFKAGTQRAMVGEVVVTDPRNPALSDHS